MFYISVDQGNVNMNIETYRMLISGQYIVHICLSCNGQGKYFQDDEDNVYVHNPNRKGISEWECPDCRGIGFNLTEKII